MNDRIAVEGTMINRLVVLGPGTILSRPGYGCSGYLLSWSSPLVASERATERPILMDCGPGTLDRLARHGTSVEEIEVILISHFHVDHVSDLAAILLSRWIRNLGTGTNAHRMTIIGPVGLSEYLSKLSELNQPWMSDYRFDLAELSSGDYRAPDGSPFSGLSLRSAPTGHTENSIGFRITDEGGHSLFYSGDTDYNESLLPLAAGADLALLECSMPDELKLDGHLTPRLAGRLAEKARVRKLLLTHFYEPVLQVDIAALAGQEYSGTVELAKELAAYRIA